ncbi:MAG TPA: hypothetical protein VFD58_19880 [Blastocatellia bacterium]|nr:hypothetical protein [Blastocatellia bacterium]
MSEQKRKQGEGEPRWRWYLITVVLLPMLIPALGLYLRRRGLTEISLQSIVGAFMLYWVVAIVVAGWIIRARFKARMAKLGSPLVDLQLTLEVRERLAALAEARRQSLAVAAFDLLDKELPRPERDKDAEELERVRHENAQLNQLESPSESQGALSVAVTVGILRRLLMLNGADEDNRHLWRTFASETALRIISDALDHLDPRELRSRDALAE